jgi:hypothetical protein
VTTSRRLGALLGLAVLLAPVLTPGVHADEKLLKHYALIYGTAFGPDNRPIYGVKVKIHPAEQKKPHWELYSDQRGEFAQRVPPGPSDYVVSAEVEAELAPPGQKKHKARLHAETKVHIEAEERQDISLHLTE